MTRVVQIAPEIAAGSGVGGVAHHLESELRRAGVRVERFTMREARGSWLPAPGSGLLGKAALALRVVWFSTVGSLLARRFLARRPDAVAICHNDVLAGDIYVNHGILRAAMRARGHYVWRMARNPLHLFTTVRDARRFRGRTHSVVVNLTDNERSLLETTYPRVRPRRVVISNGVDTRRFSPATPDQRASSRHDLGLAAQDTVALFVGHEHERKGLDVAFAALARCEESVHLVVVGGSTDMVDLARSKAAAAGIGARVHLVGQHADPRPFFHAADLFLLPSAYEANALVVLEALACGLPVLATPVGYAPEIIVDGENGFLVSRDPDDVAHRLRELTGHGQGAWRARARETAERHSWPRVAHEYLRLVEEIRTHRAPRGPGEVAA